MFMQQLHQLLTSQVLIGHLVMVILTAGLELVCARPCFEAGDFELCFRSKSSLHDDDIIYPDIKEHFSLEAKEGQKYDVVFVKREMRETADDYNKNCTGCFEDSDVVDREDHVTQYLSEMNVNTDSEITSLQESDVEDTREQPGGKDDGYFAFLTGEEKTFEVEGTWSKPAKTIVEESQTLHK